MKISALILLLILTAFTFAEDLTPSKDAIKLDIDTAVAKAFENNLSLKNSQIDMNNKILTLATTWNQFIPNTSMSASLGRKDTTSTITTTTHNGATESSRETETTNSLSAGFNTSLSLNAKMIFDVYQSGLDYKSGKITVKQAKKELEHNVKKTYYNLVLLNEQLFLTEKQIEYAKSNYDTTLLKLEMGMVSEIDRLKSEYSYKSLLPEYSSTKNDYEIGLLNFAQMIGLTANVNIELISPIPEVSKIDYDEIPKSTLENNLEIQLLKENLKSDKNSLNTYISSLTPSFGLSYSLSSSFSKDFTEDNWFDDTNDWNNSGNFNFSISIPIDSYFPFSSVQTNIIKSTNNILKSKNELQNQIKQTQISVITDTLKLKQLEESLEVLKLNIDIAEKAYNLVEQSYNAGSKGYLDLQDASNNLFDAKLKLLNTKYDYLTTYLDLKYLLNF